MACLVGVLANALALGLGLGGCTVPQAGAPATAPMPMGLGAPSAAVPPNATVPHVALLLPLTGANAGLAQTMLRSAQLALSAPGAPTLDVRDTGGTPGGAASAARAAIAAGDTLILGPATNAETGAVAPVATAAQVPVLSFTSDPAQARPGVWVLGITPAQQLRRLLAATAAQGKTRVAAVLPTTPLGDAMATALAEAAAGGPPPDLRRIGPGMGEMGAALADLAGRTGGASGTLPPPPFDVLVVAATGGAAQALGGQLAAAGIAPPAVRVLGPGLWANEASTLGGLAGAWYAAPDPSFRAAFAQRYAAANGGSPPPLADLAYDAASLARVTAQSGGFTSGNLTRPEGFTGDDGLLVLLPDGHARRGLAVFEIDRSGGAHIVAPAPATLGAAGA